MENIVIEREGKARDIVFRITDNGCWECISHSVTNGYARIGKHTRVHRYMYERYKGDIPQGLLIRHTCDNPICGNPEHLLVGTPQDNVNDMIERGRQGWTIRPKKPKQERTPSKVVIQLTLEGKYIREYKSLYSVSVDGFDSKRVSKICNGKAKTHKGYRWKFKD